MNTTYLERNQTNSSPCRLELQTPEQLYWTDVLWYTYVTVEFMHIFGFFGNVLSLLAFYKQAKNTNKAYYHQLSIMITDLVYQIAALISTFFGGVLQLRFNNGPRFAQGSWFFMFFCALLPRFVANGSTAIAILIILIGTTCDRLYALHKPMKYKTLNHKRSALLLFGMAHAVGLFVGIPLYRSTEIVPHEKLGYVFVKNTSVPILTVIAGFIYLCVMIGGPCALSILVAIVSLKYHKRMKANAQLRRSSANVAMTGGPVSEKTLTKLLLGQMALTAMGSISTSVYMAVMVVGTLGCAPAARLTHICSTVAKAIQTSFNFFVYIGLSKQFRTTILNMFRKTQAVPPVEQPKIIVVVPRKLQAN